MFSVNDIRLLTRCTVMYSLGYTDYWMPHEQEHEVEYYRNYTTAIV